MDRQGKKIQSGQEAQRHTYSYRQIKTMAIRTFEPAFRFVAQIVSKTEGQSAIKKGRLGDLR
jgi:hypothetical protein